MIEKYRAWAIDTRSNERHGLTGVYWWYDGPPADNKPWQDAIRTALFRTRWQALKYLPTVRTVFRRATVVPVDVVIAAHRHGGRNQHPTERRGS